MEAYIGEIIVGAILLIMNVAFVWILNNIKERFKEFKEELQRLTVKIEGAEKTALGIKDHFNECVFKKNKEGAETCEAFRSELWKDINNMKLESKDFIVRSELDNKISDITNKIEKINGKTEGLKQQVVGVEKDVNHISGELSDINKGVDDLLSLINIGGSNG